MPDALSGSDSLREACSGDESLQKLAGLTRSDDDGTWDLMLLQLWRGGGGEPAGPPREVAAAASTGDFTTGEASAVLCGTCEVAGGASAVP